MININIPDICLLHNVPNDFLIEQADTQNIVTITLQGEDIYTTTLYGNNGRCTFYDLRTLLHDYMRQKGIAFGKLEIAVEMTGGAEVFDDHYILFSDTYVSYEDDDEFLEKCFLTTRTYHSYPRQGSCPYFLFVLMAGESAQMVFDCVFRRCDDSVYSARLQGTSFSAPSDAPALMGTFVTLTTLEFYARSQLGTDFGTIIAYTVNVGNRSLTVYITDEKPAVVFSFYNVFNVLEIANVYGTITKKTEFSAKEARCGGENMQYDLSRDQKFQLETRALTIEEAEWLTQMFETDRVQVSPSYYGTEYVVFSEISSEISNSAKDQVRLKFSYRYKSNMLWMKERTQQRDRFTLEFTQPFD